MGTQYDSDADIAVIGVMIAGAMCAVQTFVCVYVCVCVCRVGGIGGVLVSIAVSRRRVVQFDSWEVKSKIRVYRFVLEVCLYGL